MIKETIRKRLSCDLPLHYSDRGNDNEESKALYLLKPSNNKASAIQKKAVYLFSLIESETRNKKELFENKTQIHKKIITKPKRASSARNFFHLCQQLVEDDSKDKVKKELIGTCNTEAHSDDIPRPESPNEIIEETKMCKPRRKKAVSNIDELL